MNNASSPTSTKQQTSKNAYNFKYRSEFAVQEFVMNKGWAAILREQEEEVRAVTGGPLFGKMAWVSRPSSAISYREASYSPPISTMARRQSNNDKRDGLTDAETSEGSGRTGDSGLIASSTLLRTPGEATRSSQERCWEDEGKVAERARTYVAVSVDEDASPPQEDNVVVGDEDDEEDYHPMNQQHRASTTSTPPKTVSISSQRPLTPTSLLRNMLTPTPGDNSTAAPPHAHARRTPTPISTNPYEQQRPQSIVHEVDSRSVSAVHVDDANHPKSSSADNHHEKAISERSFRSAQQELNHPAQEDDDGEKSGSEEEDGMDDEEFDEEEDADSHDDDDDDQTLEEEEEAITPASSGQDDDLLDDDEEEGDKDDDEIVDEPSDSTDDATPGDVTETLPGAGISDLDMALLEGTTPNPPHNIAPLYPSAVASPPSSPSPY
jgi:hypothetical protein